MPLGMRDDHEARRERLTWGEPGSINEVRGPICAEREREIDISMCVYIYIYMYVCIYIYIYRYIDIHTNV